MSRWVVEADGGSRGNPGPAGYGALVRAGDGELIAEVAEGIGQATNNVAEYRGLVAGLEAAAEVAGSPGACGAIDLDVRMDSKLVVEQMNGRWKIKHPDLAPLARQAAKLAEAFAAVSYEWVPRSRNAHADRLANEAMDAAAEGRAWSRHTGPDTTAGPAERSRTTGWMVPTTIPTALVLLRHGETALSGERRFSGVGDAPLTPAGEEQARAAAAKLRARGGIDAVVSSPLPRARRTAELVADSLGLSVVEEEDLRETDFGEWEGYTFGEVRERWPDKLETWLADPSGAPPGGESFAAVAERVDRACAAVVERYPERTVLVVSHVTPIKTLVRQALLAPPEAVYRMHLDVASFCEIHMYADGPAVVRSLNDTSHL